MYIVFKACYRSAPPANVPSEEAPLTAVCALPQRLISLERHYMFSEPETPAIVISHPLPGMDSQTFSLLLSYERLK